MSEDGSRSSLAVPRTVARAYAGARSDAPPSDYEADAAAAAPPVDAHPDLATLLACDVRPDTAAELLAGGVGIDSDAFARRLEAMLARRLGRVEHGGGRSTPRVIALIGPTGGGKTTTLAKLAARAVLGEGRRVFLVTLDTYRIGAVDQLRTYAEILEVPCLVAYTGEDVRQALAQAEAAGADLVLVDSAGRAPGDAVALGRLRQALDGLTFDETHLVMPVTTRLVDARRLVESYRLLKPNRLLFTKLDESVALGGLLEIPPLVGLPVSYLTFGQSVPDDIEPASPQRAAWRILDGLLSLRRGRDGR